MRPVALGRVVCIRWYTVLALRSITVLAEGALLSRHPSGRPWTSRGGVGPSQNAPESRQWHPNHPLRLGFFRRIERTGGLWWAYYESPPIGPWGGPHVTHGRSERGDV